MVQEVGELTPRLLKNKMKMYQQRLKTEIVFMMDNIG